MDYLLVDAGAFVPAGAVLEPLSHPTSAKQATSANNESIFIVMCILILFMFAYSCLGRLALGVESTKCRGVGKHYFWAFFEVARSARKWRAVSSKKRSHPPLSARNALWSAHSTGAWGVDCYRAAAALGPLRRGD